MARQFPVSIGAAPKAGQIFWCELHPEDVVHLPEFWKKRPVVVVSRHNRLRGKIIVLPISTSATNAENPQAMAVSEGLAAKLDVARAWIVCDHPMTVATSRLSYMAAKPVKMNAGELRETLARCHSAIATPNTGD